jgi:hypothetical protein
LCLLVRTFHQQTIISIFWILWHCLFPISNSFRSNNPFKSYNLLWSTNPLEFNSSLRSNNPFKWHTSIHTKVKIP